MKRNTTIVLFASIFAVAVGTLGFSGSSAISLMTAAPQDESMGVLGHVEYKVMDKGANIIKYMQGDNVVVNMGKDCVANYVFGDGTCGAGGATANHFEYIGIGNGSSGTVGNLNQTLSDGVASENNNSGTCAATGAGNGGDMARRLALVSTVDSVNAEGGIGAVVTIDTSTAPFTFDTDNATSVIDSGVFNADYAAPGSDDKCGGTPTAGADWEMFSRQLLNGATGITVNDGDSLSVKWTITVG